MILPLLLFLSLGSSMANASLVQNPLLANAEASAVIPSKVLVPDTWLTSIDFPAIVKELNKSETHLEMARLVQHRWEHWLDSERCGHLRGLLKISRDTAAKYEVITNAHFLEVIIHFDADHEESFTVRKSGEWVALKDNVRITAGKAKVE